MLKIIYACAKHIIFHITKILISPTVAKSGPGFLNGGLSALVLITIVEYFRQQYLIGHPDLLPGIVPTPFKIQLFMAWISGLRGSITIGGLAAAIKLMKYFYENSNMLYCSNRKRLWPNYRH